MIALETPIETELEQRGARFTAIKLELPDNLPQQEWAEIGRKLLRADQVMQWWIGDWAAFGDRKFGSLKEFCKVNGVNYGTTCNRSSVARNVHYSLRRENVQWSYYPEVVQLKPKDQRRFLELAEEKEMTVAELRRQIRQARGERSALESDGPAIKFAVKSCDDLVGWLQAQKQEFWTPERRSTWKQRLAPVVTFAESL